MDPVLPGTIEIEARTVRRALDVAALLVLLTDGDPDRRSPDDLATRRAAANVAKDLAALLTDHEVSTLDAMLRETPRGRAGGSDAPPEG